jgi:ssDNA-binding Zn-finger/Zn-ribbon topoisomerase 1
MASNVSNEDDRVALHGHLAEFRQALEDEIEYIKKSGQSSTILSGGVCVRNKPDEYLYSFRVEYLPTVPADTPCKLFLGKDVYEVVVVSYEEDRITISSKVKLPDALASARLENGATILMEKLIQRIETNALKDNFAGNRMFRTAEHGCDIGFSRIFDGSGIRLTDKYNINQKKAIISAITNDITYIWGPPGTGKSLIIGKIICELIHRNRSVLLLSHTNVAIDGGIAKADSEYDETNVNKPEVPYPILRLGTPSGTVALDDRLLLETHKSIINRELYTKRDELTKKITIYQEDLNEKVKQINKIKWVKKNRLLQIALLIEDIDILSNELDQLQDKKAHVYQELESARMASDNNKDFSLLLSIHEAKQQDMDRLAGQIDNDKADLTLFPLKLQAAKDALVKHKKRKELMALEANQLSLEGQIEQIDRIYTQITAFRDKENQLIADQSMNNSIIDDYNQKGSVAKFFAGKTRSLQAAEKNEEIQRELQQLQPMLKANEIILKKSENQYIESLSIREQLDVLIVTDSEDTLQRDVLLMSERIAQASTNLPLLELQYLKLEDEFNDLHLKFMKSKIERYEIMKLEQKLATVEDEIREKQRQIKRNEKTSRKELDEELTFCSSFGFVYEYTDIIETYETLCEALQQVNIELECLDLPSLESKVKDIVDSMAVIQRDIAEIDLKMQEVEKQVILQAKVIGTTLVKSYLNDTLQERSFDTVILDEASIASIPALWCASYLAEKNIVIVGDFKQLPPIFMAKTPMAEKWLGTDIFYQSGMQDKIKIGKAPENFIILVEQFRMEKEIADIANTYYKDYKVKLISNDDHKVRKDNRVAFLEWYPRKNEVNAVQLIDTENLHAWVTGISQGKNKSSRLNFFSATLCVELAFNLIEKKLEDYMMLLGQEPTKIQESPEVSDLTDSMRQPSVLIIAPYKPHIKRINELIKHGYEVRNLPSNTDLIKAGTIHSLQGSEADIVIFDLVIDEPHWRANLFMPEAIVGNMMRRMFNVAFTRARFKLFMVGNIPYCRKHTKENTLGKLLEYMIDEKRFPVRDAKVMFPELAFNLRETYVSNEELSNKLLVCTGNTFYDYLLKDINQCQDKLIIYSPFMTQDRISQLLPSFAEAIRKGCQIAVVTKGITERNKSELTSYKKCESELRTLGISIIHKKGMHEKLVFIDKSILWSGSLNALSFGGLTGEVMHRYYDKVIYDQTFKTIDTEHIMEVASNPHEQVCPICGDEMIAAESDDGGYYWTCVNKDYTRQPKQQYPSDGVLRCKCGGLYEFSMKNQPRWVCASNSSHYQYMKESDLKLDKMLKLIPQKDRKAVLKYFTEKRHAREKEKPLKKNVNVSTGISKGNVKCYC